MGAFRSGGVGLIALMMAACSSSSSTGSGPRPDAGSDATSDASPDAGNDAGNDAASDAAPDGGPTSQIISKIPQSTFEAETHLVSGGGRLLAVWMAFSTTLKNGYALSSDDGATWTPPKTMTVPHSLGDPVATGTSDGSFYYGFLDGTCNSSEVCSGGHVWVARLAPGADTFAQPVDVSPADPSEFYDKPWLMTASDGTLLLVVNGRVGTYPNNVDRLIVARSSDGTNWTRTFAVPAGATGHLASIPHACVSPTGQRMWVAYIDSDTPIYAALRWSDDLGLTWPSAQMSSDFAPASEAGLIQGYDLRCVGEGNDVWVMYGLASAAATATSIAPLDEIHVAHSGDGGATWDAPVAIKQPGLQFLRPEIARDASGTLHVMAYSGAQEGDPAGSMRHFRSSDGGKTWQESPALYQPIRFTGDRSGAPWIGDYSGLYANDTGLYATFADNASGASHIRFARRPLQ